MQVASASNCSQIDVLGIDGSRESAEFPWLLMLAARPTQSAPSQVSGQLSTMHVSNALTSGCGSNHDPLEPLESHAANEKGTMSVTEALGVTKQCEERSGLLGATSRFGK